MCLNLLRKPSFVIYATFTPCALFVSVIAEEPKSEEAKTDDAKVEEAKAEESEPKTEQTESNEEQKPGSELFKLQGVKKQPLFVI